MSKIVEITTEAIQKTVEELGYELVEVTYAKQFDCMALTIYIDCGAGVGLDDCEKVHRAIDPILDIADPTGNQPYTLNVSSPGLDRPLKTARDYEKKLGTEIEVKLFSPIDKKKGFEGILKSFTDTDVTIASGEDEITIEKNKISVIRPLIKF